MITTYHEDNDYIATAKRLIKWLEEEGGAVKNDVYNDGVSNPTIAWGVNITVKKYLGYVLTEMGIKDTTSEVTDTTADGYGKTAQQIFEALGQKAIAEEWNDNQIKTNYNQALATHFSQALEDRASGTSFKITTTEAETVFGKVFNDREAALVKRLKDNDIEVTELASEQSTKLYKKSKEYIALISLAYANESLVGNGLMSAIKNGNRLHAWYEIQYRSNSSTQSTTIQHGLAKRRYMEANLFGIWDGTSPTEQEKKDLVEFLSGTYASKKVLDVIVAYEEKFDNLKNDNTSRWTLDAAKEDYDLDDKIKSFWEILTDVKAEFVEKYAEAYKDIAEVSSALAGVNGLTMLGKGGSSFDQGKDVNIKAWDEASNIYRSDYSKNNDLLIGTDATKTYALSGSEGNDLLIGNAKDDVLYGGSGNDVLVGQNGADKLVGYVGNDTLIGGEGDDTLIGGSDKASSDNTTDILKGGSGFDTYIANNGDEIKDNKDGEGRIYFDGNLLSGTKTEVEGSNGYMYKDDKYTYILQEPDGIGVLTIVEGIDEKYTDKYIFVKDFDASMSEYLEIKLDKNKKDIEVYVGDAKVTEGGTLEFTVGITDTLDKDLLLQVESYFTDGEGSADADDLENKISGILTIKAGEPAGTFNIKTIDDTIIEPTEDFIFAVIGLAEEYKGTDMNSFLIRNAGEGTILDNDSKDININISDPSVVEGNDGIKYMSFEISTRELKGSESVTLALNIEDIDTNNLDYGSLSDSTITLDSSNSSKTVTLQIIGDTEVEPDEELWLNASVTSKTDLEEVNVIPGLGTIENDDEDDGQVTINVGSTTADEGNEGTQSATVEVTLSDKLDNDILITMSNGEVLQIAAGSKRATATVEWGEGIVDTKVDSDAPIAISVDSFIYPAPGSVIVGDGNEEVSIGHSGEVIIKDDDIPEKLEISVSDATMQEQDGMMSFTISLKGDLKQGESLTVNLCTYDGSANSPYDYGAVCGSIIFDGSSSTQTFSVPIKDDDIKEPDETFYLRPLSTSGYTGDKEIVFVEGTGTITDDNDGQIAIEISSTSANEGNEGVQTADVTVSISSALKEDITIDLSSGDSVTIAAGSTSTTGKVAWSEPIVDTKVDRDGPIDVSVTDFYYFGDEDVVIGHGGEVEIIDDDGPLIASVGNATFTEGGFGTHSGEVTVSINRKLDEDITVSVSGGSSAFIKAGTTSGTTTVSWSGDKTKEPDEHRTLKVTGSSYSGTTQAGSTGYVTIKDDDYELPPVPHDPLALDMDKDGFISTVSLADSNAYFDLTGDGIKEKVSWIQSNDALVAYDKNENGKIDGIDEVFGNLTTDGFTELRQIADSNYDSIIDRRDELYSRLQVWHDINGDGGVDDGELVSLKDAGVKSIKLDAVSTNITLEGATLTEASKYMDDEGNLELAADVKLDYDGKMTTVDTSTIPDYTIDESTRTLPTLKGTGTVYDSFISYNVNDEFKALAKEFSTDLKKTATQFNDFLDSWSGYDKLINDTKDKYNITGELNLSALDRKVWIIEKFLGEDTYSNSIESNLESTAKRYANKTINDIQSSTASPNHLAAVAYVNDFYQTHVVDNYQGAFTLQAHYEDVLSDLNYSAVAGKFAVANFNSFYDNVTNYLNDDSNSLDERAYLIETLKTQDGRSLNFNEDRVLSSIIDTTTKELLSKVYDNTVALEVFNSNKTISSNNSLIVGTTQDDTIISTGANTTILADKGDDVISAGSSNDRFIYRTGDGFDIVLDKGGLDRFDFIDINKADVELLVDGNDLIVEVDADNKVTFKNYLLPTNRIENINFADGSKLDFAQIVQDYVVDNNNDTLTLTNDSETLNSFGGDDTINALGGNDTLAGGTGDDTLYGGAGNDTYIYNLGDGNDTILDSSGSDMLKLGSGITLDILSSKTEGNDLVISINDTDTITIKNYTLPANKLENITLNDGTQIDVTSLQSATDGDDTLVYGDIPISIDALSGNDNVTTGTGDDTVDAGAGDDTVNAGSGNDTIIGGTGADTLAGGLGDDTYIYNLGDGHDTITDAYNYGYNNFNSKYAGNDTIVFGDGITQDDIDVTIVGSDIVVSINNDDSITIKNATNPNSAVENIKLHDGTILRIQDLQSATDGSDTLVFGNSDVTLDGLCCVTHNNQNYRPHTKVA